MTVNADYHVLDWDSSIFGFPVAQIMSDSLESGQLKSLLNQLKKESIVLVYWLVDHRESHTLQAAASCGGCLVDHRVTYSMKIQSPSTIYPYIIEYMNSDPNPNLITLAIESGACSRFRNDPRIASHIGDAIYTAWITNTIKGYLNYTTFVAYKNSMMAGMVTVGEQDQCGHIGLLAVDIAYRGQQIGTHLISVAQAFFTRRGYSHMKVITQQKNRPACHLYQRYGFTLSRLQHVYHFWLHNIESLS